MIFHSAWWWIQVRAQRTWAAEDDGGYRGQAADPAKPNGGSCGARGHRPRDRLPPAVAANILSGIAGPGPLPTNHPGIVKAGVPESWLIFPIGPLKTAGAAGLVLRLLDVPLIGAAAAITLFFTCAIHAHLLAPARPGVRFSPPRRGRARAEPGLGLNGANTSQSGAAGQTPRHRNREPEQERAVRRVRAKRRQPRSTVSNRGMSCVFSVFAGQNSARTGLGVRGSWVRIPPSRPAVKPADL
ncbi:hypothetical protein FHX42_001698 [Saccharopolyspora lacisalsi]|uniref:Uncharacterized protein n=1 Tax=Halosaccharopolyspora lacisalsi TaxID=1000566 RepID=A0A839DYQ9_9PSEU|nr:hypothetical protein [Halosaccharopolyspora lacisalsi]